MNTVHLRAAVNIYTKPEKRLHNFSISIQCCRYKRFFQLFETSSFDGKKNMVKYISTCLFKMNWEWNTGPAHNVVLIVRHTFMLFCFPEIVGSSRHKWKSISRKLFLHPKFSIDSNEFKKLLAISLYFFQSYSSMDVWNVVSSWFPYKE